MALEIVTEIEDAVEDIFDSLQDRIVTHPRAVTAVQSLLEVVSVLKVLYTPLVDVTVTDTADAGVAEAIAADGELGLAYAATLDTDTAATFPIGSCFQVGGTGDFTDNALATAKGGAPADGDIFQVSGADAVTFLGAAQPDFSDEEFADL
jgi:hypothetical protein